MSIHDQFDRVMGTTLSIEERILAPIVADARSQLVRALSRRDTDRAQIAIRTIVESSLPSFRPMLERRIQGGYKRTSGPHVAWKWVSSAGLNVLLVQAPIGLDWGKIVVSAFETYPGLSKRPRLMYRNETTDVGELPLLVKQAASYL